MSGIGSQVEDPQLTKMLDEMRKGLKEMPENASVFQLRLAHSIAAYQTTDKSRLMAPSNRMTQICELMIPLRFAKGEADGS